MALPPIVTPPAAPNASLEITALAKRQSIPVDANQILVYERVGRQVYPWATADDLFRAHLLSYVMTETQTRLRSRIPANTPGIDLALPFLEGNAFPYSPGTTGYRPVGSTTTEKPTREWASVALLDHSRVAAVVSASQDVLSRLIETVFANATAISGVISRVAFFNNMRLKPTQPFSSLDSEIASAVDNDTAFSSYTVADRALLKAFILASFVKTGKTQVYGQLMTYVDNDGFLFHPEDIPYLLIDEAIDGLSALQWASSGESKASSYASTADVDARVIMHVRDIRQSLAALRGRLERIPRCLEAYSFAFFNDAVELNEFSFEEFRTYVNMLPADAFTGSGISRFALINLGEDVRIISSLLAKGSPRRPLRTVTLAEYRQHFTYFDHRSNVSMQGQHFSVLVGAINARYLGRKTAIVDRSGEVSTFTYAVAERSPYDQRMGVESFLNAIEGASTTALEYLRASMVSELGANGDLTWVGTERMLLIAAIACSERTYLENRGPNRLLTFHFRRRADSPATLLPSATIALDSDLVTTGNPAAVIALSDKRLGGDKFVPVTDELVAALTERTHVLTLRNPGMPAGARLSNGGELAIPQWELAEAAGNTVEVRGRAASKPGKVFLGDYEDAAALNHTQIIVGRLCDVPTRLNMAIISVLHTRWLAERVTPRWRAVVGGGNPTYARYHMGSLIPDLVWRPSFASVSAQAQRRANATMIFDKIPAVTDAVYDLYLDIADSMLSLLRTGINGPIRPELAGMYAFWQWFLDNVAREPTIREPHLVSVRLGALGTGKRGPS